MWPHAAAEMHIKSLASRCAEVGHSFEARVGDEPTAVRSRPKANQQNIVTALSMERSPSLPVRNNVELAAQIERPWIEKTCRGNDQHGSQ
jgi:hypothetical protein